MDLPVIVPPAEEQKRVLEWLADEIAAIDKLIQKALRSCELMREHRAALISAAVTGKIDVREMAA